MNTVTENLYEEFLSLAEKYQNDINVPNFAHAFLTFTFKMMFDCAPNRDAAREVAEVALKSAYEWHLNQNENENEEGESI